MKLTIKTNQQKNYDVLFDDKPTDLHITNIDLHINPENKPKALIEVFFDDVDIIDIPADIAIMDVAKIQKAFEDAIDNKFKTEVITEGKELKVEFSLKDKA